MFWVLTFASSLVAIAAAPVRREDMPKTELLADITRECMHLRQEIEDRIKELKEKACLVGHEYWPQKEAIGKCWKDEVI